MDGLLVFWEDGRQVISSYDSDNNCDGKGLIAYIERGQQSNAGAAKEARKAEAAAIRKQRAEDIKVLGPLYGELAQLIRANLAAAGKAKPPVALKRSNRRRRRLKDD
jgi:hypothetical protein